MRNAPAWPPLPPGSAQAPASGGDPAASPPPDAAGATAEAVPTEGFGIGDFFDQVIFDIGDNALTVMDLLQALAVVLTAFLISRGLHRAWARAFKVRGLDDEGTLNVAQRLTHYAVMAFGVFMAFKVAHVNLTALAAAGAIFAVVVGFAMQNISENFVSGVILMVERSIKQGDVLEVDGRMVRIMSMGVRATVARTVDEEELIIPNSAMVKDTVKNYTLADRLFRLHTRVGISYEADMKEVRRVLERAARELPFRSRDHEPRVLMAEFGDSSVIWDVSIWMTNSWYEHSARSQLNEAIWFALEDADISIAYPQLDLHVDARSRSMLGELAGR